MHRVLYRPKHTSHNRQHRRIHNPIRTGKRLMVAGWGLFALSLCLPVERLFDGWVFGWQCALSVLSWLYDSLRGHESPGWYFSCLALANAILLFSPFLLKSRKWSPFARQLGLGLTLASALYASSLLRSNLTGLNIGYYAWIASFWLVFAGVRSYQSPLNSTPKVNPTLLPSASASLTAEELAARRELENFLRS